MANPKKILSKRDYENYRNIRAISVLFVIFGLILFVGGIQIALRVGGGAKSEVPRPAAAVMAICGIAGFVGGIAAIRGRKRWSRVIYFMAILYLAAIPLGTILGFIMLSGLSRYLTSAERLKVADKGAEEIEESELG
jgi:hypothetical protein